MSTIDEKLTQFRDKSAELADMLAPTFKEAAQAAADYKRYQNPAAYVLSDGETMPPKVVEKELKALNTFLKRFVEVNGDIDVEGVGCLTVQYPATEKVDVRSLHQHDPEAFFRLLESNGLEVNADVLKGLESQGLIGAVPKFPIAKGSPRLVWRR